MAQCFRNGRVDGFYHVMVEHTPIMKTLSMWKGRRDYRHFLLQSILKRDSVLWLPPLLGKPRQIPWKSLTWVLKRTCVFQTRVETASPALQHKYLALQFQGLSCPIGSRDNFSPALSPEAEQQPLLSACWTQMGNDLALSRARISVESSEEESDRKASVGGREEPSLCHRPWLIQQRRFKL